MELVFLVVVGNIGPFQPVLQYHPEAGSDGDEGHKGGEKERADDDGEDGCVFLLDVVRWFVAHLIGCLLSEIGVLAVQEIVVSL